ncbi:MAG TPA: hypothetical protein VIE65_19905 [Methylobacter sp.]
MADWDVINFKFDIFDPLKPPVQAALSVLEGVEALLEALLDLIKPFMLDLLNPFRAIVATLLAALRALINQIRSTGFALLLVHPDFSRPDFGGVLYSVSGAYPGFEAKVVSKFFDTSDLFRPQYPPGSTVAMLVIYIGADSPGNLLGQLFALLSLIKHPIVLSGLPAPLEIRAVPVARSGEPISQFRRLFDSDLNQAVQLEWRMPQAPVAMGMQGFAGQLVSFYNQFRAPNFIVERHGPFPQDEGASQLNPQGEAVLIETNSPNLGKNVDTLITKYNFPGVNSKIAVREEDGTVYRNFNTKIPIQFGGDGKAVSGNPRGSPNSALSQTTDLVAGLATGTYRYLDDDKSLLPGRTYYYRVRAFFGDATNYLSLATPGDVIVSKLVKQSGNQQVLRLSPKLTLGKSSRIVRGFVPRAKTSVVAFDVYNDLFNAIRVAILLNMDLPAANNGDGSFRQEQKTGWGTLGILGGQLGPIKQSFSDSGDLKNNIIFNASCRRLTNSVATRLYSSPSLTDLMSGQWNGGVKATVDNVLGLTQTWKVLGIVGGITPAANHKIDAYLSLEEGYAEGIPMSGPLPIGNFSTSVSVQERQDLADFIRTGVSLVSSQISHLAWYSVTVGDLFPALTPFMFDFEQFLLSLLKAVESALKEITDIIQTLLDKIQALRQMLESILAILDLLDVAVSVSVLATGRTNGSAESLAQDLIDSTNKPGNSPFGLHSGMVMTFGGPGQGFIAALDAIKFILTIP